MTRCFDCVLPEATLHVDYLHGGKRLGATPPPRLLERIVAHMRKRGQAVASDGE